MIKQQKNKSTLQITFIHLLFIITLSASAYQMDSLTKTAFNKFVIIKFTPLNLWDPQTPTLQLGLEYRFKKKLSAEIDFGIQTPVLWEHNDGWFSLTSNNAFQKHYKIRGEGKWFFSQRSKRMSLFLGMEGLYINKSFLERDRDEFQKWQVGVLSIRFGTQFIFNENFVFEWFAGPGIRLGHLEVIETKPFDPFYSSWSDDEIGFTVAPHISTGIKFGYRIGL